MERQRAERAAEDLAQILTRESQIADEERDRAARAETIAPEGPPGRARERAGGRSRTTPHAIVPAPPKGGAGCAHDPSSSWLPRPSPRAAAAVLRTACTGRPVERARRAASRNDLGSTAPMPTAPTVADLDLPALDYMDPELRGRALPRGAARPARATWVARADPVGFFVLDHEAVAHFMRTRQRDVPGTQAARGPGRRLRAAVRALQGQPARPAGRRPQAPAQARPAVVHARRRRRLAAGDAHAPGGSCSTRSQATAAATSSRRSPSRTRR